MARPTTRNEFREYCLRRLGRPVININVAPEQVEDRIDEALETYTEKHYDATEDAWVTYPITQTDIDNGYIAIPDDVLVIVSIMPLNQMTSSSDMFSYNYQISTNQLSPWQTFDQIDYYMKMTNHNQTLDMITTIPRFEYIRHGNRLKIFEDLGKLGVGYPLALRVYKILDPDVFTGIYNDRWLKQYATALIKQQWGDNLSKFSGVQMLGGVEMNGQMIRDQANEEIERLELELDEVYSEPVSFITG